MQYQLYTYSSIGPRMLDSRRERVSCTYLASDGKASRYLVPSTIRSSLALRIPEWFRFPCVGVGVFQCVKERHTVLDSYCLVSVTLRCVLCFCVSNLSPPPPPPKHYKNVAWQHCKSAVSVIAESLTLFHYHSNPIETKT